MTTDLVQDNVENEVVENTEVESTTDNNDINNQLKLVQEELDSKKELIKQLRKYERTQKEEKEKLLQEQGNFKTLYEEAIEKLGQYENQIKDANIAKAIEEAAKDSGVKSLTTLNKLIDKSKIEFDESGKVDIKSVKDIIKALQKTDSILFELPDVNTPSVKRANEDTNIASYETDLRKAKTNQELQAVLKKYGKI